MKDFHRHPKNGACGRVHRHSIFCILPPHVLKEISKNGNDDQKAWALQTLTVTENLRGRREALGTLATAGLPAASEKRRTIYTANNGQSLPGTVVRREGDPPTNDPAINEAYEGSGATYDFYQKIYERNSIDDRGMPLNSTVHYGKNYDNAFWNGSQMVYGDGDGEIFGRFTQSLDVIGHELTHGVTEHEAGLVYFDQPGALNESFSDVFGSLVKQYAAGQTADQADWLIGAGLLTSKVKGVALRSMKAPGTAYDDPVLGKDPQPDHMDNLYRGGDDNGGVHINSGIPNRVFYLVAMELGGHAWEKAGKIWYLTLKDELRNRATFRVAAKATIRVAEELYGDNSKESKAVQHAWEKVGVIKAKVKQHA